jgi:hypothetical protein
VKIPLPNLDDRRWADLVEEGRSLIPLYAPDWTDHNIHDPGITLLELFAWVAEMDIYRLNRITDEHRLKFLRLIGIAPDSPRAARTVVSFTVKEGYPARRLRRAAELAGDDVFGTETRFRTLDAVTIAPGRLQAIQLKEARAFQDLTASFEREQPFAAFGRTEAGAELYLGFTKALARNRPLSLYFKFAGPRSGYDERARIIKEASEQREDCLPIASQIACEHRGQPRSPESKSVDELPPFHGARTCWEFLAETSGGAKWLPLDQGRRLIDETRAFTLDGRVVIRVSRPMAKKEIGRVETPLYWLRCRFEAGAYDAAPVVRAVIMNAARAEQATKVPMALAIRADAIVEGDGPEPGGLAAISLELDEQARITRLKFDDGEEAHRFRVLSYTPPSTTGGSLTLEAVFVGKSRGQPLEEFNLAAAPVQQESLKLFTLEEGGWREWALKRDFDAATPSCDCFTLDATGGVITFGDGKRGRTPPAGALIFAVYRSTRAQAGNLAERAIDRLVDSPRNRALLEDFDETKNRTGSIANPIAAEGGRAAETLESAEGRAIELMSETRRAVTLKDYEEVAMKTPGAQLARVAARAGVHPSFPCLKAPGIVLLIILPSLPAERPVPGAGLKRAVSRYINRRRVIGTRVEVVGPTYLEVAVRARVKALDGASRAGVRQKIVEALNGFFDPLRGGPEGKGWPFGRDVYRSEVLQVIDEVAGVDHVFTMDLIAEGCEPQCGNVCLGPTWLVAAGRHEIEVI